MNAELLKILQALLKLETGYEPHVLTGGYDPDDISLCIPEMFWESRRIQDQMWDLQARGLVREIEAPMGSPWPSHWKLTTQGREAVKAGVLPTVEVPAEDRSEFETAAAEFGLIFTRNAEGQYVDSRAGCMFKLWNKATHGRAAA
jgi:hypothetical protein